MREGNGNMIFYSLSLFFQISRKLYYTFISSGTKRNKKWCGNWNKAQPSFCNHELLWNKDITHKPYPFWVSTSMAAANAPTPGKMSLSALRMSFGDCTWKNKIKDSYVLLNFICIFWLPTSKQREAHIKWIEHAEPFFLTWLVIPDFLVSVSYAWHNFIQWWTQDMCLVGAQTTCIP